MQTNVRGRDLGSYVEEARAVVERQVDFPPGVFVEGGGQYENLQAASRRLSIVIPAVFALIFGILFMALRDVRSALTVYSAVPLGLAGGVFGLFLAGLPFSISAAVGFIVLSGVTVLNGLVVMSSIRQRIDEGVAVADAISSGMMERVRAVLITGVVPAVDSFQWRSLRVAAPRSEAARSGRHCRSDRCDLAYAVCASSHQSDAAAPPA